MLSRPHFCWNSSQVVRLEKIVAEFGPTSQISVRVAALKSILATRLAPRILLPAVTKCYSEVLHTRKVRAFFILQYCDREGGKTKKQAGQNLVQLCPLPALWPPAACVVLWFSNS